jgi:outer membrane protein TolC
MISFYRCWAVRLLRWGAVCGASAIGLVGCTKAQYKAGADREVYQVLDRKWKPEFGPEANYKISDIETPSPTSAPAVVVPPSGILALADAVALATAQNREYQTQKEDLYLTALDLTLARHQFDPLFFGTLGGDAFRENEEKYITANGEFGFNLLLATGAQITTSIASDWLRFMTGEPRESLTSVLSATITQPLLRGGGSKVVLENLTQAERDTLYQCRAFSRFRKTFVVSIITDYFRVLQTLSEVSNAKSNYESLKTSQQRLEALAEAGRLPPFQVDQARQDVFRAEDTYVRAQEQYNQRLDEFKIRLGLPATASIELDPNELAALGAKGVSEPEYGQDEAIQTALAQRLDIANARDQVDDAERKVGVAANSLLADVNIVGSANVSAPQRVRFGQIEFNQGTYDIGLDVNLPLDRKAERNAYRESLINVMRRQRDHDQAVDEVKLQVRQDYRDLRGSAQRYRIQQTSLSLALRRVESTELLIQAGRADTRDLLEAQSALLQAQNATTAALVSHSIARLNFFRDVDVLQVRPDGFWEISQAIKPRIQSKDGITPGSTEEAKKP